MIVASLSNSVNATEITLHRQTALRQAKQAKVRNYDPSAQLPHGKTQYEAWEAYWQPFWDEQKRDEQLEAGRIHHDMGLPIETCSTPLMQGGWRQAQQRTVEVI